MSLRIFNMLLPVMVYIASFHCVTAIVLHISKLPFSPTHGHEWMQVLQRKPFGLSFWAQLCVHMNTVCVCVLCISSRWMSQNGWKWGDMRVDQLNGPTVYLFRIRTNVVFWRERTYHSNRSDSFIIWREIKTRNRSTDIIRSTTAKFLEENVLRN